jgi:hypothetical protein
MRTFRRRKYDQPVRLRGRSTFPVLAGTVLAAAALVMLLVRLPAAFHSINGAAKAAVGRNQLGGALATADSIGLNNDFVVAAFADIPKTGRFAVVVPPDLAKAEAADGINPLTFAAAPPFFEDYLLPRRIADRVAPGVFIVCLGCKSPYWDKRTHWLSPDNGGGIIGLVYR